MFLTKNAKNEETVNVKSRVSKMLTAAVAALSTISPAFADPINPDTSARTILKLVFNIMMFGGIIFAGIGAYMIGKAISDGENAPPGAIGKGIGFAVAGIILIAARFIVEKITGTSIDEFSFFG